LNIWNNNGSQFDVSLESADTIVVGGDSSANDISVTAQSTKGYAEISSMSGADNITLRVDDVGEFFRIWSSDLRGSTISLTVGDVAGFSVFSAVRGYRSGASECPAA
jgi:hypothetical protein